MADNESTEWIPKSREDWVGIFKDGSMSAAEELRSKREEEEAKRTADEKAQSDDKTGNGGGSDSSGGSTKRSFAERLLGIK